MKKLAIIGGGYMAGIYSKNAHEMGIETHAFSLKSGVVNEAVFDYVYDVNILERDTVLKICQEIKIDGVVATTELTISTAAYIASKMGLHCIPCNVAEVITDKYRNRKAIENIEELRNPKYRVIYSIQELLEGGFNYPLVIKPTSKGGKRGVVVVNTPGEIKDAFDYALKDSGNALPIIAEEYIFASMECSVESLSYEGKNYIIQITEKITSGPPHCVELGHKQPAALSDTALKRIRKAVDKGLSAIGVVNGPCHTEIRIAGEDIYLVEFNARPGGDHIAYPLTELSTGYPYIKGAIQIALGDFEEPQINPKTQKYAGVLFVTEQTSELKPLFDRCEQYDWFYSKNKVSDALKPVIHNDGYNTNFFMYCDSKLPDFDHLL